MRISNCSKLVTNKMLDGMEGEIIYVQILLLIIQKNRNNFLTPHGQFYLCVNGQKTTFFCAKHQTFFIHGQMKSHESRLPCLYLMGPQRQIALLFSNLFNFSLQNSFLSSFASLYFTALNCT